MCELKVTKIVGPMILIELILPFIVLFLWAFSQSWPIDSIFPARFGFRGWTYVFSPYSKVFASLGLSVVIAVAVTVCAILISIPAGKALGLYDFPGKNLVEILVLAPIIIPPITMGMGLHMYFIKLGLADTFAGVLLVHLTTVLPYGIRIFASSYKAMGGKWEEQARVLKAGRWQRFIYVTLPFLYPALLSGAVLMFNVSFSQYFLTFLIGGGNIITLPVLLFPFVNSGDRVIASVISVLLISTSILLMIIFEKMVGNQKAQNEFYYL